MARTAKETLCAGENVRGTAAFALRSAAAR